MPIRPDLPKLLRDYQLPAARMMIRRRTALEYDDMGLGKTLTTLCAIDQQDAVPCIIVCPKFALYVWQVEIDTWLGVPSTVYSGKPKEREKQWRNFIVQGQKFLITNYAMLGEIANRSGIDVGKLRTVAVPAGEFKWQAIVWDEAHMGGIFNHKKQTFEISSKFSKNIPVRYVLTGTPIRQGCTDLFAPLQLIEPKIFNSYWRFVDRYCTVIKDPFGKHIERNPSNIQVFRNMLSQYMIRRIKEEVLEELPGKLRQTLYVEMNDEQHKVYNELTQNLIAEIPGTEELLITPGQMTLLLRQRQILDCPQVLGLKHRGGAIDTLIEHSHLRLDDDKPIVVFTPFRQVVPYLDSAFKEEYDDIEIYHITGGLTAEEFGRQWQSFQQSKKGRRLLICVIKSSASFQATAADTAYFLGYEWDFNLNEQAEDRLNRMGQRNFVNIFYIMYKDTADMAVAAKLNEKKSSSNWIVGTQAQYMKMLKQARGLAQK